MNSQNAKRKYKPIQVGDTFGRLTVVSTFYVKRIKTRHMDAYCVCSCSCGTTVEKIRQSSLKMGETKSCGCLQVELAKKRHTTHGMHKTGEYEVWSGMIKRCENATKDSKSYKDRGIKVCDRWRHSFKSFFNDMGKRPSEKHSIDRINTNGNYCKKNCRWATSKQQGRNKRNNVLIRFMDKNITMSEWSEITGIRINTIWHRIRVLKWNTEKALTTPVRKMTSH